MSFHVKLYQIAEEPDVVEKDLSDAKENDVNGVLFQDLQDVSTPWVELDKAAAINPGSGKATFFTANYAYIPQMSRYYFITGREIYDNDHYVLRLEVDPMMTFKTTIKATQFFVDRNENAGSWMIPDGSVPMAAENTITHVVPAFFPFDPDEDDPAKYRIVLAVAGGTLPGSIVWNFHEATDANLWTKCYGALIYYALNISQLVTLAGQICDGADLVNWFDDTKSGVFSLHALPFDIDIAYIDTIQIGNKVSSNIRAGQIHKIYRTTTSDEILLATCSDFRNATSDYQIRIWLPGVGWQSIDPVIAHERPYLKIRYTTNVLTGATVVKLYLYTTSGAPIVDSDIWLSFECSVSREIPLTLNNAVEIARGTASSILSSALALGGAIASQNPAIIAGSIASTAVQVGNRMLTPVSYMMKGTVSGAATLDVSMNQVIIQYIKRDSPVLDNPTQKTRYAHKYGKMYQQTTTLSSLTGKTVVNKFEMPIPAGCTMGEYEMIRRSLAEGVIL